MVWCKNLILEFRTKPEPGIIAETNNEKDRLDATEADNRAAADHTPHVPVRVHYGHIIRHFNRGEVWL